MSTNNAEEEEDPTAPSQARELVIWSGTTKTRFYDLQPVLQGQLNLTRLVISLDGNSVDVAKLSRLNR